MTVTAGTRIGHYEVTGLLGAGGMGEVYRAHDSKLGRDVAIKILSSAFASDPDRLTRFAREARLLAALNHPNIGAIYGIEEGPTDAGQHVRALVQELVEGETLADRIAAGPMPVGEALRIARQVAGAHHRRAQLAGLSFPRIDFIDVGDTRRAIDRSSNRRDRARRRPRPDCLGGAGLDSQKSEGGRRKLRGALQLLASLLTSAF